VQVPGDWKKANAAALFKDVKRTTQGTAGSASFTSVPGKNHGVSYLRVYFWACEREARLWRQHEFIKGKSHLTNPTAFYDKMTGFLSEGTVADVI